MASGVSSKGSDPAYNAFYEVMSDLKKRQQVERECIEHWRQKDTGNDCIKELANYKFVFVASLGAPTVMFRGMNTQVVTPSVVTINYESEKIGEGSSRTRGLEHAVNNAITNALANIVNFKKLSEAHEKV